MIKGFNRLVKNEGKSTRTMSPEKAAERAEAVLAQIRTGQVLVSEKKGQYKKFVSSPDLLVDRCVQALKYGAKKETVQEAAKESFAALRDKIDWKKGKAAIYDLAGKKDVSLNDVAFVFGLEDEGTHVVPSDAPSV